MDLLNQINDEDDTFEPGMTTAKLTGRLKTEFKGWGFEGSDDINILSSSNINILSNNNEDLKSVNMIDPSADKVNTMLFQNYPNPTSGIINIKLKMPKSYQKREKRQL